MPEIDYPTALKLIESAFEAAEKEGVAISVAVVDGARDLLAFGRDPRATQLSGPVAQNKAVTARFLNMSTSDIAPLVQPGAPLYGLEASFAGPLTVFAGGHPIRRGDVVLGALGVSGGTVEQDEAISVAALAAVTL